MLLATASIVPAATARWPLVEALFTADPVSTLGCVFMRGPADLIFVAAAIYDIAVRHAVHPVYLWGGFAIVTSQALRILTFDTEAWHRFTAVIRQLA